MVRGLHHLALRVADVERARAFYAELLGLPELRRHADENGELRALWLDLGGGEEGPILMLERALRGVGPERGSGHVLALRVEGLESARDALMTAGVEIVDRTGYTLFVCDPDGHRVGLSVFDSRTVR